MIISTKSKNERPANASNANGLARWRKEQAEDKERRLIELENLRQDAITIVRDDREYRVVTIPDRYTW